MDQVQLLHEQRGLVRRQRQIERIEHQGLQSEVEHDTFGEEVVDVERLPIEPRKLALFFSYRTGLTVEQVRLLL